MTVAREKRGTRSAHAQNTFLVKKSGSQTKNEASTPFGGPGNGVGKTCRKTAKLVAKGKGHEGEFGGRPFQTKGACPPLKQQRKTRNGGRDRKRNFVATVTKKPRTRGEGKKRKRTKFQQNGNGKKKGSTA